MSARQSVVGGGVDHGVVSTTNQQAESDSADQSTDRPRMEIHTSEHAVILDDRDLLLLFGMIFVFSGTVVAIAEVFN